MNVLGRDERASEVADRQVATPPGVTLKFKSAEEPPEVVTTPVSELPKSRGNNATEKFLKNNGAMGTPTGV